MPQDLLLLHVAVLHKQHASASRAAGTVHFAVQCGSSWKEELLVHKQQVMLCHVGDAPTSLTSQHASKMLICRPRLLMSGEPCMQHWKTLEIRCCDLQGSPYAA